MARRSRAALRSRRPRSVAGERALAAGLVAAPLLHLLTLALMVAAIFVAVGPLGTNLTDEGVVLDWAYRILHGAVPHRDIISPRPLGTALLHLVDLLQPFPVLITSRLITIAEVVAYSALFASVCYRTPLRRWHAGHLAGVLFATLVNLHTFPLMAWYTIDGLLLCAVAARLLLPVRPHSRRRLATALLCCGAALVVKQSFFVAPPLGLATVAVGVAPLPRREQLGRLVLAVAAASAPLALYVAWVAAAGGLLDMARQFIYAGHVDWFAFLTHFAAPRTLSKLLVVLLAAVIAFTVLGAREGGTGVSPRLSFGALLLGTAAVGLTVVTNQLSNYGSWGASLQWVLAVAVLVDLRLSGRTPGIAVWLLLISYGIELSFGYQNPNLVVGSIALYLLYRLWASPATAHLLGGYDRPGARRTVSFLAGRAPAVLAGVAVVFAMFAYEQRRDHIYRELPAPQLTASAADASGAYRFISVDPVTARYLRQIRECLSRYPARRVAVVPDTPSFDLAFDAQPALPITLVQPVEYAGSEGKLLRAVQRLDREGDYLVLVQTWEGLTDGDWLPEASLDSRPVMEGGGKYYLNLLATLSGQREPCGSFVGIYKPAPSRAVAGSGGPRV